MKTLLSFLVLVLCGVFFSCKNSHAFEKYVKELDSLKIVVEQAVDNFKTVDSAACMNAYSKQITYTDFINKNLKDTITKTAAENVQAFYKTGNGFKSYLSMRSQWLKDAGLSIKQLSNLSHDLKNKSIETEDAIGYINTEKRSAEKIIEELKINTEAIRAHLELYTKSLPATEDLVRRLNNGSLPALQQPDLNSK